jgi:hypothetical protein
VCVCARRSNHLRIHCCLVLLSCRSCWLRDRCALQLHLTLRKEGCRSASAGGGMYLWVPLMYCLQDPLKHCCTEGEVHLAPPHP